MQNKEYRLLKASEIQCRAQTVKEYGFSLLLYKDARVDMQILDETYGRFNWQRRHRRDNANCIIEVWDGDKSQWVAKEDVGVESYTEKEKGLASDSFKRAGFNWGIGRELYTAPFIWIKPKDGEVEKDGSRYKLNSKAYFYVDHIAYDDNRQISELVIKDKDDNTRFTHGTDGKTVQGKDTKSKSSRSQNNEDKATARDLKGVKDSTDMNVQPAIAYIRDTSKDKLEGFVTEDEDRITILRVWDSKMGTNLSGEFGNDEDTSSSSNDSENSDSSQKTETESGTEQSSSDRSVEDAINAIINDDNLEPNEKVNKLVGGIYQVHTNPSHDDFEDREFDQYDPDEFQDKYYSVIQEAITKVQE